MEYQVNETNIYRRFNVTISDMQIKMILHELASIVGRQHVIVEQADLVPYTVDIFWLPRLMFDRGGVPPMPDVVVIPGYCR